MSWLDHRGKTTYYWYPVYRAVPQTHVTSAGWAVGEQGPDPGDMPDTGPRPPMAELHLECFMFKWPWSLCREGRHLTGKCKWGSWPRADNRKSSIIVAWRHRGGHSRVVGKGDGCPGGGLWARCAPKLFRKAFKSVFILKMKFLMEDGDCILRDLLLKHNVACMHPPPPAPAYCRDGANAPLIVVHWTRYLW